MGRNAITYMLERRLAILNTELRQTENVLMGEGYIIMFGDSAMKFNEGGENALACTPGVADTFTKADADALAKRLTDSGASDISVVHVREAIKADIENCNRLLEDFSEDEE